MRRDLHRRDLLRGIGTISTAGMLGLAGCTLQPSNGGNNGSGDGNGSNGSNGSNASNGNGNGGGDGPDALIVIGYPGSGIQLFKDYYNDYDTGTEILVSDGLVSSSLPGKVGRSMKNVRGTAPAAGGKGRKFFANKYEEVYSRSPSVFTSHAYDATVSLLLANLAAGKNDAAAIRDNLRSVSNPKGPKMGPDKLVEAAEMAAAGKDMNYVGASSSVNYDDKGDMQDTAYGIFSFSKDGLSQEDKVSFEAKGQSINSGTPPGTGSKSGRTLKIGMLMALTGGLADLGKPIRDGAILPIKQLKGNIDFTIDSNVADSQTATQPGINAANSLVSAGYPDFVGPLSSGVNIAVCESVYIPNKVVASSPSSTSTKVTSLKDDDYVFRTAPSDKLQGQIMARITAEEFSAKTASVMYVNNDYGQALSNVFAKTFKENGGKVLANIAFTKNQSSYSTKIQQAMSSS